ncbi:MAG: tetratricopeptide repeat protein [Pseudomonadota bacterium]
MEDVLKARTRIELHALSTIVFLGALVSGCSNDDPPAQVSANIVAPTYVGSEACQTCHRGQAAAWRESHHYLAMLPATEQSVVGDFDDAHVEHFGTRYQFQTKDGRFVATAEDDTGELQEFDISHTFGIEPLQQYLITFPDGRLQALSVAWDSRPAAAGGQRWFHLYPDERIAPDDELHWTGRNQNWNYMCADCHSTDLNKNYRAEDNTYATTWAEINVGCEACHGPGSAHIDAARRGSPERSELVESLQTPKAQVDTCAHCHSRRGILNEGFEPGADFLDHYRLSLLDEGLYYPDGQILDEVYVTGSFLQSKMHQQGVRCTDCHDPHSAEIPTRGNDTCTQCHQGSPPNRFPTLRSAAYDTWDHHFHAADSAGAQCVNCHMASRDYMVIDPRRDHSFRIPRPDLTASLGVPNACNGCHDDQTPAWAEAEIRKRYPDAPGAHFGEAIAAGRARTPHAAVDLVALAQDASAPAIVRGTALSLLAGYTNSIDQDALAAGLNDPDALVRFGALRGIQNMPPGPRWQLANHLLDDPLRLLRTEAAATLAPMLDVGLAHADSVRLRAGIAEYIETQTLNSDRPGALTNLGSLYAQTGDARKAEATYRQALTLAPDWVPALVNLADIYRAQNRETQAAELLQKARTVAPNNGDVRYAYGLSLVRRGQSIDAIDEFREAAALRRDVASYAYAYGIALNSNGRSPDAIAVLETGAAQFPANVEIRFALATIERDRGNRAKALEHAQALRELRPQDPNVQALIRALQASQPTR